MCSALREGGNRAAGRPITWRLEFIPRAVAILLPSPMRTFCPRLFLARLALLVCGAASCLIFPGCAYGPADLLFETYPMTGAPVHASWESQVPPPLAPHHLASSGDVTAAPTSVKAREDIDPSPAMPRGVPPAGLLSRGRFFLLPTAPRDRNFPVATVSKSANATEPHSNPLDNHPSLPNPEATSAEDDSEEQPVLVPEPADAHPPSMAVAPNRTTSRGLRAARSQPKTANHSSSISYPTPTWRPRTAARLGK